MIFPKHLNRSGKINQFLNNRTTKYFIRLLLFIVLYKAGEYSFKYLETTVFFSGLFDHLYYSLSWLITHLSVTFYSVFYAEVYATADFQIVINGRPAIVMMHGCTGLVQLFQVCFMLLFFPMPVKAKLLYLPVALLILLFASILHYLILVPVAYSDPGHFPLFHDFITRAIFYTFFFINFVLWNRYSEKLSPAKAPGGSEHPSDMRQP